MGMTNCKHVCYVCHKEFDWCYKAYKKGIETLVTPKAEAEVIATGNISGSDGVITQYEFIVECPNCKTKNKIIK